MKSFDTACYKLAIHFLTDEPMNGTVDAERYRQALASHIQSEVESWIQYERSEFEARGGRSPNDPMTPEQELEIYQGVMRRIETLMGAKTGTPEGAELDFLVTVAASYEERAPKTVFEEQLEIQRTALSISSAVSDMTKDRKSK